MNRKVLGLLLVGTLFAGCESGSLASERAMDFCLTQVIPAQAAPDKTYFLKVIYDIGDPGIYKVSGRVHRVNPQGVVDRSGVFTCVVRVKSSSVTLIDSSLN